MSLSRSWSAVIRWRIAVVALVALVATGAVACSSSSDGPATPPSTARSSTTAASPNPGPVPHGLQQFYDQSLHWISCRGSFQCARLTVPEDYTKPGGRTLSISVIRKPSSERHAGSLIVNPGGPGASGVDFVAQSASIFSQLTAHYDLVSFDPRGVGGSDPIRCVTSDQLDRYINENPQPQTPAAHAAVVAQARAIANACFSKNGSYLEHVGTIDEARDMDVLRAALGDRKLTYYGASYGTYLGAKYAQLFPGNIRAMVLDGAVDPAEPATQTNLVQAKGFQVDLSDFLSQCVSSGKCPLGSTVAAAHAELESLRASVTAHPQSSAAGRVLGPGVFFEAVAAGLYEPDVWPELWTVLGLVKSGNPTGMFVFSDALTGRNSDGSYNNLIEANLAINCIDRPAPRAVSTYDRNAARFAALAPDFGAAIEYGSLPCAFWKVPPVESVHPVHAPSAPPILVIGTTRDPATPYVWAQALANQLRSGILLTHDGDGHTAYVRQDACVDAAVQRYVVDLQPPSPGTTCQ